MAGIPLDDAGGTSWTAKTGLLELVWLASATAAPLPWVYCRCVLTHDGEGTPAAEMSRTPISTGVTLPARACSGPRPARGTSSRT